jgi:hypothetical protein
MMKILLNSSLKQFFFIQKNFSKKIFCKTFSEKRKIIKKSNSKIKIKTQNISEGQFDKNAKFSDKNYKEEELKTNHKRHIHRPKIKQESIFNVSNMV